jgi:hypothetical protein
VRFKCTVCHDYDLCARCEAGQVETLRHRADHPVIIYRQPRVRQPEEVVHRHVTCDGCGASPIRGLRFQCSVCDDYDLCASCEGKSVETLSHQTGHPMIRHRVEARRGGCMRRRFQRSHQHQAPHQQHGEPTEDEIIDELARRASLLVQQQPHLLHFADAMLASNPELMAVAENFCPGAGKIFGKVKAQAQKSQPAPVQAAPVDPRLETLLDLGFSPECVTPLLAKHPKHSVEQLIGLLL